MKTVYSEKFLRKRKFLLVLPVLVLPFITLAFYALGGGKGSEGIIADAAVSQGLNIRLPGSSQQQESMLDKMSFYQQAERDSARMRDQEKSDPYYKSADPALVTAPPDSASDIERMTAALSSKYNQPLPSQGSGLIASPSYPKNQADANEQRIMMKLAELDKAINQPVAVKSAYTDLYPQRQSNGQGANSDVDRLEGMMQVMNSPGGQDSEMQQLNGTLEKILDIQHPERVSEKIRQASAEHKTQVFPVSSIREENSVSLLQSPVKGWTNRDTVRKVRSSYNGFYSLQQNVSAESAQQNSIDAVIDETQTLVTGATVKLRLASDIYVNGILIPRGTLTFGTASLSDERLKISIGSIRFGNSLYPVSLSVYDIDGMEGIFVPGTISRDVAKESTSQALQGIGLTSLNPSLSVQAASAGIQAAKTLLTRKAKLIRVTVKMGYRVLLQDASQKN